MSYHCTSWAKAQTTGNPTRKAILMVIADYANAEGVAYPGRETIMEESEAGSLDTVDRAIKALEVAGLITVERGRKILGKQLPNQYRLNIDLERLKKSHAGNRLKRVAGPQNAARDGDAGGAPGAPSPMLFDEDPEGEDAAPAPSPAEPQTGPQTGPQTEPQTEPQTGPHSCAALTKNIELRGEETRASARDPQDDLFDDFWRLYPQHGHGYSKDQTRVSWRALSFDDRRLALMVARDALTGKHMKGGKPKNPAWWLHDRNFATIAEERGWTGEKAPASSRRQVFVEEDTP